MLLLHNPCATDSPINTYVSPVTAQNKPRDNLANHPPNPVSSIGVWTASLDATADVAIGEQFHDGTTSSWADSGAAWRGSSGAPTGDALPMGTVREFRTWHQLSSVNWRQELRAAEIMTTCHGFSRASRWGSRHGRSLNNVRACEGTSLTSTRSKGLWLLVRRLGNIEAGLVVGY